MRAAPKGEKLRVCVFVVGVRRQHQTAVFRYSHLFGINTTGLRFFTVYGPWGRPDMALFKFTKAILAGEPIDVYNNGRMRRNFTYIDDVVAGVQLALDRPVSCEIYNVGNGRAEELMDFIREIEKNLGKKAVLNMLPMQAGDVAATVADIEKLRKIGYEPRTNIDKGVRAFVAWYREYYGC
jgi:UDP-glucuronate 4-epimerase